MAKTAGSTRSDVKMSEYTPKERFQIAIKGEKADRPPVCGMTTAGTTELMDYTGAAWPEVHVDAKLMAKLGLGMYPFVGLESIRIPYCLTYEVEALGGTVDLGKKNSTPMVKGSPFHGNPDPDFETMDVKEMLNKPRNKVILEAAEIINKDPLSKELPTLLGVTGPFTIAGHLAGTESLILWTITEPDVTKKFTKYASEYERMWLEYVESHVGFDSIQMSEPTASYDMISPEMFQEFAAPNLRWVYEPLKETKKVLHICGNMLPMLDEMISSNADGLSLEEKTDPYKAVEKNAGRCALIGNVGVVNPLLQGTPEQVKHDAIRSADAGFSIISAGCGLSALIKKENLAAMVEAIKAYRY